MCCVNVCVCTNKNQLLFKAVCVSRINSLCPVWAHTHKEAQAVHKQCHPTTNWGHKAWLHTIWSIETVAYQQAPSSENSTREYTPQTNSKPMALMETHSTRSNTLCVLDGNVVTSIMGMCAEGLIMHVKYLKYSRHSRDTPDFTTYRYHFLRLLLTIILLPTLPTLPTLTSSPSHPHLSPAPDTLTG